MKLKKVVRGSVGFLVVASTLCTQVLPTSANAWIQPSKETMLQTDPASKAPVLTITELLPDTSNVGGSDAYEFIEIYNNSNKDINLKDYKLYYTYPDSGSQTIWWESSEDVILPANQVLVFWVKNAQNQELTIDDFNKKFQSNLTSENLIEIQCDGMANSSVRGVRIATNVNDTVDEVQYNVGGQDDTTPDHSILFQNRYENEQFTSVLSGISETPTVGTISEEQRPQIQAQLPESVAQPSLQDQSDASFQPNSDVTFALQASSSETMIKTVTLYLKDNQSSAFSAYTLQRQENSDLFAYTLSHFDVFGKQSYEYYFVVSDGYHTIETEKKTIQNTEESEEGTLLNLKDGDILSSMEQVIGTGDRLFIDDQDVTSQSVRSIRNDAKFIFETSQTDVFFKNAVSVGADLIGTFHEGTYDEWKTYDYAINAKYFDVENRQVVVQIHAGNKANELEHNVENNDDFVVKNIRMVLPDGTSLRPSAFNGVKGIGAIEHTEENWKPDQPIDLGEIKPETEIKMGDSTSKVEILYVTFDIPEASFDALRYDLDTTLLNDGAHTITSDEKQIGVQVDNTAPVITSNVQNNGQYRNLIIEANASDAISGVASLEAKLDGKVITLPFDTAQLKNKEGSHDLQLVAIDQEGNRSAQSITFTIPQENANIESVYPASGSVVGSNPTISVKVNDPTDDQMNVVFKKGEQYTLQNNIVMQDGIAQTAGTAENVFASDAKGGFPYQKFDVKVEENVLDSEFVKVKWQGTTNNEKTFLYAYNLNTKVWDQIEAKKTTRNDVWTLEAVLPTDAYLDQDSIHLMVQNGEGYTPNYYGEATTRITTSNPEDTPRDQYDFTFIVESDTQYYNEDFDGNPEQDVDGNYQYQLDIHDWIIANQQRMNIQYLLHNGDIIDDEQITQEWEQADAAYKMLDDAKIPYGILAGNHDVGHLDNDYTSYSKYFGEARYANNPWYGESYQDNKGHYDLITVDGIDFIMVYMGWGVQEEEIAWMNEVLAQYPERKAILNFHEYLLASGGLGEEPQQIYDEVVAKNPNVFMVLSGHYHNAQTRVDAFDDDNDGIKERQVYQMLFDYQGLKAGGMGYIRLMHFDTEQERILIRTYSPSLDDYNAKDETDIGDVGSITEGAEEFEIPFAEVGLTTKQKELSTLSMQVDVYGNEVLGEVKGVKSGDIASITLSATQTETLGWYAEISDAFGGLTRTDVNYLHIRAQEHTPTLLLPEKNTYYVGETFDPMAGVSAKDHLGNDITHNITVDGNVDMQKAGQYVLTYTVYDADGNQAVTERVITVLGKSDTGNDNNSAIGNGTSSTSPTQSPQTSDVTNTTMPMTLGILSFLFCVTMLTHYKKEENER